MTATIETAFTDGPWIAQADRTVSAAGMPLLRCYAGRNEIANASLIAAAPDMFEALLCAEVACMELCHDQHPDNQCWVTLATVRAALAKATSK